MSDLSEKAMINEVQDRLARKFEHLAPDHISVAVQQAHARFDESRVRDFVPLLVERRATKELFEQSKLVAPSR